MAARSEPERETVDIIASGYEWECPACGWLNKEMAWQDSLECQRCGVKYYANPPEHAYG